ncbi:MAG: hypothetical protein DRP71_13550 [Verrucomicrobia bacterium]|nr:MAG: hypothetical protein DRP71_13550 [Verrucomicrobiota bacterium]
MNHSARILKTLLVWLLPIVTVLPVARANPAFSGLWTISAAETTTRDPEARSTATDPWRNLDIQIEVAGDQVSITRSFRGGSRVARESMTVDTSIPSQVVTVEGWWDNRHIGAYLGDGKKQTVAAKWLDGGRTLQLNIEMILETSQAETPVRVLREMRLSDDGETLVVIQLRSSRNTPVVRFFKKA